jgi:NADPH:quinone reductase-like Zn-dependent oxidoreductase
VGAVGIGIAKNHGCEVTGVDRASKLDALTAMGFDHVIDYQRTDFTSEGKRYDLILDTKTTRSPFRYLSALGPGGRYVTVGGNLPRLLQVFSMGWVMTKVTGKRLAIVGLKPNEGLNHIIQMFESDSLPSVIDGPYPLADVPRAMERFGKAEHIGKIVIRVALGS